MVFYPGDKVKVIAVQADGYAELARLSKYIGKTAQVLYVYDQEAVLSIDGYVVAWAFGFDCLELVEREYISRVRRKEEPKVEPKEEPKEKPKEEPKKPVSVERPSKDEYYMEIAKAVSMRSTCLRRRYGAVIVKDDEIISTGYNGAPRGEQNCSDAGVCYRMQNNVPHGERYEACKSVHAEMNAIISARRSDMIGATLYLYGYDVVEDKEIKAIPCDICARLIKNAGIARVVSKED